MHSLRVKVTVVSMTLPTQVIPKYLFCQWDNLGAVLVLARRDQVAVLSEPLD